MAAFPRLKHSHRQGFTLIEALVAMSILGIAGVGLGGALLNIKLNRSTRLEAAAAFLVQSEIEALRSLPFTKIQNQTNGPFRNILYQQGAWSVATATTPPSGTQVVSLQGVGTSGQTGLAIVPVGSGVADGTLIAHFNIRPTSPSGWQVGYLFRAQDREHAYRVWLSSSQVKIQKVAAGVVTDLYSLNQAYATNTWYKVEIILSGNTISLKVNNSLLTLSPITDTAYATGSVALTAFSGASMYVDSVSVQQTGTDTWNFDTGETLGNIPVGWERFGSYDLPAGTAQLTIANAESGFTDIKKVTATITHTVDGAPRSKTLETLISQRGIGQ